MLPVKAPARQPSALGKLRTSCLPVLGQHLCWGEVHGLLLAFLAVLFFTWQGEPSLTRYCSLYTWKVQIMCRISCNYPDTLLPAYSFGVLYLLPQGWFLFLPLCKLSQICRACKSSLNRTETWKFHPWIWKCSIFIRALPLSRCLGSPAVWLLISDNKVHNIDCGFTIIPCSLFWGLSGCCILRHCVYLL